MFCILIKVTHEIVDFLKAFSVIEGPKRLRIFKLDQNIKLTTATPYGRDFAPHKAAEISKLAGSLQSKAQQSKTSSTFFQIYF